MWKSNTLQRRHVAAGTLLLMLGVLAAPATGTDFEPVELPESAFTQRSAADIAAMVSDCLETWAFHQQSVDEEGLESAFSACQQDAIKKFEDVARTPDDELVPLVSGDDGRGLDCTLPKWDCHTTTRCPRPWSHASCV